MTSKKLFLVTSALAPIACSAAAFAGDYPAHSKATKQAIAEVKKMPEFAGGVGSSKFPMFDDIHGDTKELLEKDAVNEPDQWACFESVDRAPPRLTRILSDQGPNQFFITRWLGTRSTCGLAMACNYTHFVDNPVETDLLTAKDAERITSDWAHEIIDNITQLGVYGPDQTSWFHHTEHDGYCDEATWNNYWRRVLKSLHFVQDQKSEDHQTGNVRCGPLEWIPPLAPVGVVWGFYEFNECGNWLLARWNEMTAEQCDKSLTCDQAVYTLDPTSKYCSAPSNRTAAIMHGCFGFGITAACMGLERLIYHHCNYEKGKSFTCALPEEWDNCSGDPKYGYCEGEVCPDCGKESCPGAGGENYVLKAKIASVPKIKEAAGAWAEVCKEPVKCTPDECKTWCWKSYPTQNPAESPVRGDCIDAGQGCTCVCNQTFAKDTRPPKSCEAPTTPAGKLDGEYEGMWPIDPSQCYGIKIEPLLDGSIYATIKGSTIVLHISVGPSGQNRLTDFTGTLTSDGTMSVNIPSFESSCLGSGPLVFTGRFSVDAQNHESGSGTWSLTATKPPPSGLCSGLPTNANACGGTWTLKKR